VLTIKKHESGVCERGNGSTDLSDFGEETDFLWAGKVQKGPKGRALFAKGRRISRGKGRGGIGIKKSKLGG